MLSVPLSKSSRQKKQPRNALTDRRDWLPRIRRNDLYFEWYPVSDILVQQSRRRIYAGPHLEAMVAMVLLEKAEPGVVAVSSSQRKVQRWRYSTLPIWIRMSEGVINQEFERPTHLRSHLIHLGTPRTKLHIAQFLYAAIFWVFETFVSWGDDNEYSLSKVVSFVNREKAMYSATSCEGFFRASVPKHYPNSRLSCRSNKFLCSSLQSSSGRCISIIQLLAGVNSDRVLWVSIPDDNKKIAFGEHHTRSHSMRPIYFLPCSTCLWYRH